MIKGKSKLHLGSHFEVTDMNQLLFVLCYSGCHKGAKWLHKTDKGCGHKCFIYETMVMFLKS